MKLFHVNVVCSDLERSYKFYTDVLGLAPLTRRTAGIGDSKSATDGKSQSVRDGRLPGEARQSGDDAARVKRALALALEA